MAYLISDEEIQKAVDYLRDGAPLIGQARINLEKTAAMIKHVEALMFLDSTRSSVDAKKAEVRASPRWIEACEAHAKAAGEFEMMKAYREAASAKLSAWQTVSANFRGIRI